MAAVLVIRLTGGSSNTDPNISLGGLMSSGSLITSNAINNLFRDVTSTQRSSGVTQYRALSFLNVGDASATTVKFHLVWASPSSDSDIQIGYDVSHGSCASNSALETIGNEYTSPSTPSISFSLATPGSLISLPDIAVGEQVRVWFRRVITADAGNRATDTTRFRVSYA